MAGPNYMQTGYGYTPYMGYPSPAFANPAINAASANQQVPINYSPTIGISPFSAQPALPAVQPMGTPGQATWNDLLSQFSMLMQMFNQYFGNQGANLGGGTGGTPGIPSWMSSWSSPDLSSILGPTGTGTGTGTGTTPGTNTNPNAVQVRILEVGTDGKLDNHSATVADIYNTAINHWGGASGANLNQAVLDGNTLPPGAVARPEQYNSKKDLDQFIDNDSTYALAQMTKEINATKSGVVNASMGWSRDSIYKDVVGLIKEHPNLAKELGLSQSDLACIKTDSNGKLDLTQLSTKVKTAVTKYVDNRLNPNTSAYKKALGAYQKATHTAANDRNVTIVVAAGNDKKLSNTFNSKPGADTNFLALSHDVISVASVDTKGTESNSDDVMGDFSSNGNAYFKPTIAAKGVDVQTNIAQANGSKSVKGTSYSAPLVTALIARMLEVNPKLTPAQITKILQKTATDNTKFADTMEGAGLLNPDKAIELAKNPPA